MAKKKTPAKPGKEVVGGTTIRDVALALAAPVAGIANLESVFMEESTAKRTLTDAIDETEAVNVAGGVEDVMIGKQPANGVFGVHIKMSISLSNQVDGQNAKPFVEIMARYVLVYRLPSFDGVSDENLTAFASTSGVFSLWPYWREFVHATSLRLMTRPIVLPTYRV